MRLGPSSLLSSTAAAGGDVLRWWLAELGELARPLRLGRRRPTARTVLEVERGRVRIGDAGEPLAALEAVAEVARREPGQPIGLRLSAQDCFTRRVELPRAAAGDARRILQLQLEHVMPFRQADVAEAHCLVPAAAAAAGKVVVLHAVAKRSLLDPLLAACERHGLPVAFVDARDRDGSLLAGIDFLRPDATGQRRRAPAVLALLAAALVAAALLTDDMRRHAALATLTAETAALREELRTAGRDARARETAAREAGRVDAARAARPPVTAIIEELSRLLPDSTVLQQLRVERGSIDIAGTAAAAVALLPLLEQSPLFHDVRLTGPVSIDPRDGRERFGIRLQLRIESGGAPAPVGGRS